VKTGCACSETVSQIRVREDDRIDGVLETVGGQRYPRIIVSSSLGLATIEATVGPEGHFRPIGEHSGWDAIDGITGSGRC
jgi:hypothetical protein